MRTPRHLLEAGALWALLWLFRFMPVERASALGGRLGRLAGRFLHARNRVARRNIEASFPGIADDEVRRIVAGMWENFGSYVGEFPHLHDIAADRAGRIRVVPESAHDAVAPPAGPVLYVGAHYGNFEVATAWGLHRGLDLAIVYRRASNPWSERVIRFWRAKRGGIWIPKGRAGARGVLAAVRQGRAVAILADQKLRHGVAVPFFGRDAMTAPAVAELALRHDVPIVPVRIVRRRRARFEVRVGKPLDIARTGDRQADVRAVLVAINRIFEGWIREHPGHWLWLHHRWPDS